MKEWICKGDVKTQWMNIGIVCIVSITWALCAEEQRKQKKVKIFFRGKFDPPPPSVIFRYAPGNEPWRY